MPSFNVLPKLEKAQCRFNSGQVYMYLVNGIVVNRLNGELILVL